MHPVFRRRTPATLFCALAAILCLTLGLSACQSTKGGKAKEAADLNPNQKQLAYGASITLPPSWKSPGSLGPEVAKANLDSRRQSGERILILEALGSPSPRGLESMIAVFVVNQEGTFMPRDYAEKLKPEEFTAMAQDLMKREKQQAKKSKSPSNLLDLQLASETIGGMPAVSQKMLVAGPDGSPVRLSNWDIYLPGGAGIAVKTVCDQQMQGAENEIIDIVRSIRVKP